MQNKIFKLLSIPIVELFGKALAFITIILMTHILTIQDMGTYSILITIVMISSVFMDGGINNKIYSSILQEEEEKLNQYYSQKIIFSFLTVSLVSLYSYLNYDYWVEVSLYIIMTFFVSQIILFKFIYRANQDINNDRILILIDPLFKLFIISLIYTLSIDISLKYLIFIFLISSIIEYRIIEKNFHKSYSEIKYKLQTFKNFFTILKEVKYFILFYFLYILYQRIDIFFIENFLNTEQVAVYFSAYTIYVAIIIFVIALLSSSFPKIKQISLMKQIFYFKKYLLIYFIFLLLSYYLIPFIYPLIYPDKYTLGIKVLFWLLCSIPFVFITNLIILNFNFLKLESKNLFPIITIFCFKIFMFINLEVYFTNIIIFSQIYFVFESILSIIFLIIYKRTVK